MSDVVFKRDKEHEQTGRLSEVDQVVRLRGCPDCDGRGWFFINPFATGGTNGCGGLGNMRQCGTCLSAEAYWKAHGRLPDELQHLDPAKKEAKP